MVEWPILFFPSDIQSLHTDLFETNTGFENMRCNMTASFHTKEWQQSTMMLIVGVGLGSMGQLQMLTNQHSQWSFMWYSVLGGEFFGLIIPF